MQKEDGAILLDQYCNPSNPIGKKFTFSFRTESGWISLMISFLVSVRKL